MEVFIASFVVVGLAILGMAIGALAGRHPLQGGCGKNRAIGAGIGCGACGVEDEDGDPLALRRKRRSSTQAVGPA